MSMKLTFPLLLGSFLVATSAAQAQFTFVTNSGTIAITGYNGPGGVVTIPDSISGLPVTSIAVGAISSLSTTPLTVVIPAGVTNLGDYAFSSDYGLTSVYFAGNAPSIGAHVFIDDNLLGASQTAYFLPGAGGWGAAVGAGVPTKQLPGIAITAIPTNGLQPLLVSFSAADVDSGGRAVTNWNWDFGDGSTSTSQNPSYTYSGSGSFSVALLEKSNGVPVAGGVLSILASPLTIAFSANPTNGLEPLTVSFNSGSTDSGGHAITHWNWNFGDGSTGIGQNPSHVYSTGGAFSVGLVATNELGLAVSGPSEIIRVSPLTVVFAADPANGSIPLTVNFTSASVDNGGHAISNWKWSFGDGSTSAAQNPSHSYTNTGTFSISLVTTNNIGYAALGSGPASILALPPPQDAFTFSTNNGTITITGYIGPGGAVVIPGWIYGLPVTAIQGYAISDLFATAITVTIPGNITVIGDYAFEFNYDLPSVYFLGNAPNIGSHVFVGDDVHGLTPMAYYLAGATGWGGTIGSGVPTTKLAGISATPSQTQGAVPLKVSFTAAGVNSGGHSVTNWNWDFGDGSTSSAQNPSHTYITSGTFSFSLLGDCRERDCQSFLPADHFGGSRQRHQHCGLCLPE